MGLDADDRGGQALDEPTPEPDIQQPDVSGRRRRASMMRRSELAIGLAMLIPGLLGLTSLEKDHWMLIGGGIALAAAGSVVIPAGVRLAAIREGKAVAHEVLVTLTTKLAVFLVVGYAGFGASAAFGGRSLVPVPGGRRVPAVTGRTETEAVRILTSAGLRAVSHEPCAAKPGSSTVAEQAPEGGVYVKGTSKVTLSFAKQMSVALSHRRHGVGGVSAVATARVVDEPDNPLSCESLKFRSDPAGRASIGPVRNHGNGRYSAVIAASGTQPVKIVAVDGSSSKEVTLVGPIPAPPAPYNVRPPQAKGGVPAKLSFSVSPSGGTAATALSGQPQVTVSDIYGRRVSAYRDTLALSLAGDGQGALSGCTQEARNGLVRFSGCTIDAAGRYRLRVSDRKSGLSAESREFVVADSVAKLLFAVSPSDGTVGVLGDQPVVDVLDGQEKLYGGHMDALLLSAGGNGHNALNGCRESSNEGGVVKFSGCEITAPGRYRLRIDDQALGLSAESQEFVVADRVAKLLFAVSPPDGTIGVLGDQPVVDVLDGQGKPVGGYRGTLVLSIGGDEQTSLRGCREDSNEGGVVKFAGCRIDAPGRYRLHVTDEALALSGNSEQFTLSKQSG